MGKEKLLEQNRRRVFEIYGINPHDPSYDVHHIVFKSDFKKRGFGIGLGKDYMNSKANLYPMLKEEHRLLHQRIEEQEPHIIYRARRKGKPRRRAKSRG